MTQSGKVYGSDMDKCRLRQFAGMISYSSRNADLEYPAQSAVLPI